MERDRSIVERLTRFSIDRRISVVVLLASVLVLVRRELERYHDTRILITDPRVAHLTVSGVFQLEQPDAILRALAVSHDLDVEQLDDNRVKLLKAEQ